MNASIQKMLRLTALAWALGSSLGAPEAVAQEIPRYPGGRNEAAPEREAGRNAADPGAPEERMELKDFMFRRKNQRANMDEEERQRFREHLRNQWQTVSQEDREARAREAQNAQKQRAMSTEDKDRFREFLRDSMRHFHEPSNGRGN